MKNQKSLFLLVLIFLFCTIGCSFSLLNNSNTQIRDIRNTLSFSKIIRQSFMGGSVLYNPVAPSSGQLSEGATVAVRLGYFDKQEKNIDEIVYVDIEDKAQYGYITINSINTKEINFTFSCFKADGITKTEKKFTIKQGESIDINSDNLVDLYYDYPIKKRPGFEKSLWLTFLCCKETQNTSMFAILPEQYDRSIYPSGILGINPYGKFIVNKYELNSLNRAAVQGVTYGDYVLDTQTGEYQRIISNSTRRYARAINDDELENFSDSTMENFYFSEEDFNLYQTTDNLLNVFPQSIKDNIPTYFSDIEKLNYILEQKTLLKEIANKEGLPFETAENNEAILMLETASQNDIVKFNRLFLESFYPESCPMVDRCNESIATIFPYLSVLILNPDDEIAIESNENKDFSRSIGTTDEYRKYLEQKNKIDDLFVEFHPIKKYSYELSAWEDLFGDSSSETNSGKENNKSTLLVKSSNTNLPLTAENKASLKLGLMGHFKVTDFSIEGGIYVGLYITGDTSLDLRKVLAEYSLTKQPQEKILLDLNLELLNIPPINLGVLSIKLSSIGGFTIPVSLVASGTITTNYYAGFTGFYAAGFDVGTNFTYKTKNYKIFGLRISIPYDIRLSPYANGRVINETAYFVGPVSDITTIPGVKLQSGKIELCFSPSAYIEPQIVIGNSLYGGVRLGPKLDIGFGLKFNIDDSQQIPKNLELYDIFGIGLNISLTCGLKFKIPIFNIPIDLDCKVDCPTIPFIEKKQRPIKTINFN